MQADYGSLITDVAVLGLDTFAIAREDGSVTVVALLNQFRRSELL